MSDWQLCGAMVLICRLVVPPFAGSVAVPKVQADSDGSPAHESCTGCWEPTRGATVSSRFTLCPVMTVGVPAMATVNGAGLGVDDALTVSVSGVDELAAVAAEPA